MNKKVLLLVSLLFFICCFTACGAKNEKNNNDASKNYSFTLKETKIYNYFKDELPEFDFDNAVAEKYDQGKSYVITVECSEKEQKKYIKKLKKSGFEQNAVETETYYSATDSDGYYVEVTYVSGMLTVYVKKA